MGRSPQDPPGDIMELLLVMAPARRDPGQAVAMAQGGRGVRTR